jgi:hypothetical protein
VRRALAYARHSVEWPPPGPARMDNVLFTPARPSPPSVAQRPSVAARSPMTGASFANRRRRASADAKRSSSLRISKSSGAVPTCCRPACPPTSGGSASTAYASLVASFAAGVSVWNVGGRTRARSLISNGLPPSSHRCSHRHLALRRAARCGAFADEWRGVVATEAPDKTRAAKGELSVLSRVLACALRRSSGRQRVKAATARSGARGWNAN